MQWTLQQHLIIAVILDVTLFFAGCHAQPDNTRQNIDSSKTMQSTKLKNTGDTIRINQGKTLFVTNCGSCHAIFKTDNYLQGVVQNTHRL